MLNSQELKTLSRAKSGDPDSFSLLAEPYRRELLAHAYRMLGSSLDAEEAVQETMLRAWNGIAGFTENRSFRAWLYKIATNFCLDRMARSKRTLPTSALPPGRPDQPPPAPLHDASWIEPAPDGWFHPGLTTENPEAHLQAAESVRLAFIAALQLLPPRQRAVLILRDVLDWRAKETAELLDMSIGAANSALYRARNRLAGSRARLQSQELRQFPIDPATLDRYTRAWERADVESLTSLLVEEAAFAMPPFPLWFQGRESIGQAMKNLVFQDGPGEYRLVPAGANLQPAFGLYRRENDSRRYAAGGLQILEFVGTQIRSMTVYLDPIWNAFFGLPTHLPDGEPSLPSPG